VCGSVGRAPVEMRPISGGLLKPGNLGFVVHRLREDADEFLLYETYKDEAAFLAHREMTHFKNLIIAEAVPRLERREIQSYALLD